MMKNASFWSRRLAAALCAVAMSGLAVAAPKAGDGAPDYVGRTPDGQPVSLAAYKGKVVVLSFWASWCGPCQKELPILEGIQRVAGEGRIQVVAVNIEDAAAFRKMARKLTDLKMLVASDAAKDAQRTYGVSGIPHMVIVGKTGDILRIHRGYSEAGVDDVIKDVNQALAG